MRQMLAASHKIGPAKASKIAIAADMDDVKRSWSYLCERAVQLGLMTCTRTRRPKFYATVHGWQGKIEPITARRREPIMPVNSVFNLSKGKK